MSISVGVDLGQSADPTAIVALSTVWLDGDRGSRPVRVHTVRLVGRLPLGTPYPAVVDRVVEVGEAAAAEASTTLVVDNTGVGRPVVDMLRERWSGQLRAVTMTAGLTVSEVRASELRVPKRELVASLEVVLQTRRLRTVPGLALADDLAAELRNFEYRLSPAGSDSFEGARGRHDDLVMALCLAVWFAERPAPGRAFLSAWRDMAGMQSFPVGPAHSGA